MQYTTTTIAACLASLALAGCASGPETVERDFGNSVRQMVRSQTLDPLTANKPDTKAPEDGDGQRIDNVMDAYRNDVSKPEEVNQPLVISVGD